MLANLEVAVPDIVEDIGRQGGVVVCFVIEVQSQVVVVPVPCSLGLLTKAFFDGGHIARMHFTGRKKGEKGENRSDFQDEATEVSDSSLTFRFLNLRIVRLKTVAVLVTPCEELSDFLITGLFWNPLLDKGSSCPEKFARVSLIACKRGEILPEFKLPFRGSKVGDDTRGNNSDHQGQGQKARKHVPQAPEVKAGVRVRSGHYYPEDTFHFFDWSIKSRWPYC